jgi:SagB-type dehydrogenase family enzyme
VDPQRGGELRDYHERTKHSLASVRSDPYGLEWDNQPLPFKVYTDLEAIPLPTELPGSQMPALDAIGGLGVEPGLAPALDLACLARLLYFSAGVLRRKTYPGGEIYFRAAACTGALYHVDVYAACGDLPDLPAGVYHFSPHDFALRRLRAGDHRAHLVTASAGEAAVAAAPVVLLLTSTFWRNAWKYRDRTYRHCWWDAGTILANLLAGAASVHLPARVVLGFVDEVANRLVDVDPAREATLALVAVGDRGTPASPAAEPLAPLGYATLPLSPREIDYPLVRNAHAASVLRSPDEVRAWRDAGGISPGRATGGDGTWLPLEPLPAAVVAQPIEAVIARRGSTRRFPRRPIPVDALATVTHLASRAVPFDVAVAPSPYLIANAVDGLEPGTYACDPDGRAVRRLRDGDFRREAGHLGLGQDLPADAAANVYWLADLDATFGRLGNRGYRAAQLTAAVAGGRAYLVAYALGLGATGLTFFDDDVTRFFGLDPQGVGVMFLVAVGDRRRAK